MRDFFQGVPVPRLILAATLLAVLFGLGTYDERVFTTLTTAWQHTLAALGLDTWSQRLQQSTSTQITTRSLPAMLTYGLGYTVLCLLILWLVLPARAVRTAAAFYGTVFLVSATALLMGKLIGDAAWLYKLGRHLIDFIVSPLPVIALVPLLRWYYAPPGVTAPLPR